MNWNRRYAQESDVKPYQIDMYGRMLSPDRSRVPFHKAYPHILREYDSLIENAHDEDARKTVQRTLELARGAYKNPDTLIKIYRFAPEGSSINPRDWVTVDDSNEGDKSLLTKQVPASHLYTHFSPNTQGHYSIPTIDPYMVPHCSYYPHVINP